MTRLRRLLLRILGSPLAAAIVLPLRLTGRQLGIAVMYHGVGDPRGDPEREIVARHGTKLFEGQLRHLQRTFRVVDAAQLLDATASRRRGQRFPAVITFDDDLPAHARVALPILRHVGVTATFFVCGASLSRPFAFWWERLQRAADRGLADLASVAGTDGAGETLHDLARRIELMTPADRDAVASELEARLGPDPEDAGMRAGDVRALVAAGMKIGFHTRRHDSLPMLDDAALAHAMREGKQELESLVGYELDTIAYPHGRADKRAVAAARNAGFRLGFTCPGEPVEMSSDPLLLPRIAPYYRSVGQFAMQLALQLLRSPSRRPTT